VLDNRVNRFAEIYFSREDGVPSVDYLCSLAGIQKMLLHGCRIMSEYDSHMR
jgi:hypothetical protein